MEIARRTAVALEIDRSRQASQMLFEASPTPMWVYDVESLAFLAVNDAAIRHYGYARDEFLAMTIKDIRPAEEIPRLLADVAKPGLAVGQHVAAPAQGRDDHRRRDHRRPDRLRGPPGGDGGLARRQRAQAARTAARRRREDGGDRPPRRRRRARLQQPADGDRRLRRDPARARRRLRGADGDRPRRRAGRGAHPPAARVQPPPGPAPEDRSTSTRSSPAWRRCCTGSSATTSASGSSSRPTSRRWRPIAPRSSA